MNVDDRNPYSPPSAAVADISTDVSLERPAAVVRAVRMLWISFAVGVANVLLGLVLASTSGLGVAWPMLIIVLLVAFGIAFAICYWIYGAIHEGKNWARILLLVFMILGASAVVWLSVALVAARQMPALASPDNITSVVQWALSGYATWLLFTSPSNRWFRAMKEART